MRRLSGQALRHCWTVLHRLLAILIAFAVVVSLGVAVLAWRLSRGPIDMPWLAQRIEAAVNPVGTSRLQVGSAALAWEGFHAGLDSPLDIRLTDVELRRPDGSAQLAVPRAELTLSVTALFRGRLAPRTLVIEQPSLTAQRTADGALRFTVGGDAHAKPAPTQVPAGTDLEGTFAELARPPANDSSRGRGNVLSQVRLLRIQDASLVLHDDQLGVTWQAPQASLELSRLRDGGVHGTAALTLALAGQQAQLHATADLPASGTGIHIQATLSSITPAAIAPAAIAPAAIAGTAQNATASPLAPLQALDMPVQTGVELTVGPHLRILQMHLTLDGGPGTARVAGSPVPIERAVLVASGTPEHAVLQSLRLVLPGTGGTAPSTVQVHGNADRTGGRVNAQVAIAFDQLAFAALPTIWPAGLAKSTRAWIVQNIPSGVAHEGHFDFSLAAAADLSGLALTAASGAFQADGLTVHWLRPAPPILQGEALLQLVDPDRIDIKVLAGQEASSPPGASSPQGTSPSPGMLSITGGQLHFTGLTQHDQQLAMQFQIAGPVPAAVDLLRNPRLGLLARHPMPLNSPSGQVNVGLTVSFPLIARLTADQVTIAAQARLTGLHLAGIAAGRDLDQGTIDLSAGNTGLAVNGDALLAGIPVQVQASMDFRPGPPAQVVQRVTLSGRPDARQLAAAGLDPGDVLIGPVPLTATLSERRNGSGSIQAQADLTPTALSVQPLGWRKPAGTPARAEATLALDHDRLSGIDPFRVQGDRLELDGSTAFDQGRIVTLRADRILLGGTQAQGVVQFPPDGPIAASFSGPTLDLSGRFANKATTPGTSSTAPGPPWSADARFDRVILADGHDITGVSARAADDGRVLRELRLQALTGPSAPVSLTIQQTAPRAGAAPERSMTLSAGDAGALLRAVGAVQTMDGGRLAVNATYQDGQSGHPLVGTAEIDNFRLRNAVGMGKLLQAMTLYGLVQALRGPGVGFTKLTMPFRWQGGVLTIAEARAMSPSLGLTAKGWLDLDRRRADMQGTIVPAYFFNSLLGRIPLLGRLFSPERGGGLFAASYAMRGPLDDPTVTVNPLTAVTPGFLRGLFGGF
ncbi:MAG TPA: AsmA-like C-terminal region-containing protein [Acetobacteraceae bacterium]